MGRTLSEQILDSVGTGRDPDILDVVEALTTSAAELNYLDIASLGTGAASKAVVLDASANFSFPASGTVTSPSGHTFNFAGTLHIAGTAVTATATEINRAADASGFSEELTATGNVTAGVKSVELNHATVAVVATIADAANHAGFFYVVNTSASGTAAHQLVLTSGTFDGTNNTATLNAPAEALLVFFDGSGNGRIIENYNSVALS